MFKCKKCGRQISRYYFFKSRLCTPCYFSSDKYKLDNGIQTTPRDSSPRFNDFLKFNSPTKSIYSIEKDLDELNKFHSKNLLKNILTTLLLIALIFFEVLKFLIVSIFQIILRLVYLVSIPVHFLLSGIIQIFSFIIELVFGFLSHFGILGLIIIVGIGFWGLSTIQLGNELDQINEERLKSGQDSITMDQLLEIKEKDNFKETFAKINELRKEKGLRTLDWDERAYTMCIERSKDMAKRDYFSHLTPDGECMETLKSKYGFRSGETVAENIWMISGGSYDADDALNSWIGSPGHYANLFYKDHVKGAIGCYERYCTFIGVNNDPYGLGAAPCSYYD